MKETFYITTAIDYPNGAPHLGHAYEKIVSDFYARYHRLMGRRVHFLTGTDENGQKLKTAAEKLGEETMAYVDDNVKLFRKLCRDLNISHDDFIRTTEERHHRVVHEIWQTLQRKNLIYRGEYTGPYCEDCENFYTESQLIEGQCPHHHKEIPMKTEKGHFFKLAHFQDWIISFIEKNEHFIVPGGPQQELLSRLKKEPLKDLSISRPNEGWGIGVPDDKERVIYTWFDALINYYSALDGEAKKFWPATCHVIGRDITWFHCVIWPCLLHAAEIPLPKQVYVHGMVLDKDGKKMSKSLGNGVDPNDMLSKYGPEAFRFYILKSLPAHANGRFSESGLIDGHNNLLANDYGNLMMRVVKMTRKRIGDKISLGDQFKRAFDFGDCAKNVETLVLNFEHDKALDLIWSEVGQVNRYINEKKPWAIKEAGDELNHILHNCLYAIHALSYLLHPALPQSTLTVLDTLGAGIETNPLEKTKGLAYHLKSPDILFKKIIHE